MPTPRKYPSELRERAQRLVGVVLFSNAGGSYLGNTRFDPLFAELQARGAVVFVHPTASPDPSAHRLGLPDSLLDFVADTFRRLYWDTALSWHDPVLRMLRDTIGLDHVLDGSDYPYLRRDLAIGSRAAIQQTRELTDTERTAILNHTATTLIPRLIDLAGDAGAAVSSV